MLYGYNSSLLNVRFYFLPCVCHFEDEGLWRCDTVSSGEYFPTCQRIVVHLQGQGVKEDLFLLGLLDPEDVG